MFGLRPFNLLEAVFILACSAVHADPRSGFLVQRAPWTQIGIGSEPVGLCLPYPVKLWDPLAQLCCILMSQGRSQFLGYVQTSLQSMKVPGKFSEFK